MLPDPVHRALPELLSVRDRVWTPLPPKVSVAPWAMRVCPDQVPWHRVVNARGEISLRPATGYHEQRVRLKAEGVRFDRAGRIDLNKYGFGGI